MTGCHVCGRTRGPWWRAPFDEGGMPRSRPPLCLRCGNAPVLRVLFALALKEVAQEAGLLAPFAFLAGRLEERTGA